MSIALSRDEREILLRLARAAIRQAVSQDDALSGLLERTTLTPGLHQHRGAFVSLKKLGGEAGRPEPLRGCIGCMGSEQPLYRKVIDLAPKAALEDPRFPPLPAEELSGVRIELSVLSPLRRLNRIEDLIIGRHGVQLEKGEASAVFLPQVAGEHGWSRDVLLRRLALKAGLPGDAWQVEQLSVFEAEVFGEPRAAGDPAQSPH